VHILSELLERERTVGVEVDVIYALAQIGFNHNAEAGRLLAEASPDALEEANRRYEMIWPQLHGEGGDFGSVPGRTERLGVGHRKADAQNKSGLLTMLEWTELIDDMCSAIGRGTLWKHSSV
jgi:hypothetical protein